MSPDHSRPRLSAQTLGQSRVAAPSYDRSGAAPIVHLGMGAFARAHLATYADDLLTSGGRAMIRAVSLRSPRAAAQLAPQDGLFTVTEREDAATAAPRLVGSVASMRTGPEHAIAAIADPATTLVTLTVTEDGYQPVPDEPLDPSTASPLSAAAVLALGLDQRRRDSMSGLVVASMDNLLDNGPTMRARVLEVAKRLSPELSPWIETEVPFPSSVVDRMVPATTPTDLDDVVSRLGLTDLAAVSAEHHRSWFIEAADGFPPLADVGVNVVRDIEGYQRRKLWLLNAPHSAFAYCGLLTGCVTIADAATHPDVSRFVERLTDDIIDTAQFPASLQATSFAADARRRFANSSLGHTCQQVGADGSGKLPQRLFPVVAARRSGGGGTTRFALVAAIWLAAASGLAVGGRPLPIVADPAQEPLRQAATSHDLGHLIEIGLGASREPDFKQEVDSALRRLVQDGPMTLVEGS
jgi:fructuronate reductase